MVGEIREKCLVSTSLALICDISPRVPTVISDASSMPTLGITLPPRQARCNENTRLVGSQGSTETYPSTTRTCITRLGYFPS